MSSTRDLEAWDLGLGLLLLRMVSGGLELELEKAARSWTSERDRFIGAIWIFVRYGTSGLTIVLHHLKTDQRRSMPSE